MSEEELGQSILTPPPYLSPSSISTYQQCPLKFKFSRIDKLEDPPTEATLRGNYVHSVFEELYKAPKEERTLEYARTLARDFWWNQYCEPVAKILPTEKEMRLFRWSSWWCIENLFEMESPDSVSFDGLEYELNSTIAGVQIKGFIDRWKIGEDGGIHVGDYKTGKTPGPRYREDKFFQLLIYAHVLQSTLEKNVTTLELLYVKDSVRLSRQVTDGDFQNVENVVTGVKRQVDESCSSGVFATKRSRLCDWCSYKSICPEWSRK